MKTHRLLWILWLVFFWTVQIQSQTKTSAQTAHQRKPPGVLDSPVNFSGWIGTSRSPDQLKEIRIGFFAPVDPDDLVGASMLNAAVLAVEEANAAGGFQGVPFRLVKRWAHKPWGAGSKEMIKLVYQDSVWAVIGSLNGSATHVAEQVVTKAWVPLLSPVSADPTLTYIRIPWMFRLPPDDQKQAEAIVHKGIQALSLNNIGLITSTDHDGRIFAKETLATMNDAQTPPVFHFQLPLPGIDFNDIVQRVLSFNPDGVIVRLPWGETLELLNHFQHSDFDVPVFIPWIPGLQEADLTNQYDGDIFFVQPFSGTGNPVYTAFAQIYRERYEASPTPGATYTYDAVNILIQSLQKSGLNRARLRDAIAGIGDFHGATGKISWDNGGGNVAEPVLRILSGKAPTVKGKMQKINILH